ncbi:MAG TPA: hypothetical protein VL651_11520, partial [Bacteroidia bacterium]|nr:hypothetical protein [Bacteroidia bacterium]
MRNKYPLLTGIAVLALAINVNSQIFYSNGALIAIKPGAVVWSNGGVTLDNTTNFTNDGSLTVTKNSTFPIPGDFTINNSSASQGNGTYQVEQDWIN